jgi:transposase
MLLTMKEKQRLEVMQALMDERLTIEQAAQLLSRSHRQVWRLLARLRAEGVAGIRHKSCERVPWNKSNEQMWRTVIKLAQTRYVDVNDRHLQELLEREHSITVGRESLRKRLRQEAIPPKRKRRARKWRMRRERKPAAGTMLQIDASPHDWLEGRGPQLVMVGAIDDATNRFWGLFVEAETTWAYFELMRQIAISSGLPLSLYSDRHDIFHTRRAPTLLEQLENKQPQTQFGRAMAELGIAIIKAYSPQAKGRIERQWGLLQDRLVVELRLANACNKEEANALLQRFVPELNRRFSILPQAAQSVFRVAPGKRELERILCWKQERVVNEDHTISYEGIVLQLPREKKFRSLARKRVMVLQLRDQSLEVHYQQQCVARFTLSELKSVLRRRQKENLQHTAPVFTL